MTAENIVLAALVVVLLVVAVPIYRTWRAARRREDAKKAQRAGGPGEE